MTYEIDWAWRSVTGLQGMNAIGETSLRSKVAEKVADFGPF